MYRLTNSRGRLMNRLRRPDLLRTQLPNWPGCTVTFVRWCGNKGKQVVVALRNFAALACLGDLAAQTVGSCHGAWRLAKSPALYFALSTRYFPTLGLVTLHPVAPAA